MNELGQIDLLIGRGAALCHGVADLGGGIGNGRDGIRPQSHQVAQGLTDDGVQGDKDGEGQEGPQTAGHGIHALPGIQVRHLRLLTLLVVGVAGLDLLDLALHTAHAQHTLFALELEGQDHQLHHQGEEDQRQAVRPGQRIKHTGQPGEGHTDVISELCDHIFSSV